MTWVLKLVWAQSDVRYENGFGVSGRILAKHVVGDEGITWSTLS